MNLRKKPGPSVDQIRLLIDENKNWLNLFSPGERAFASRRGKQLLPASSFLFELSDRIASDTICPQTIMQCCKYAKDVAGFTGDDDINKELAAREEVDRFTEAMWSEAQTVDWSSA